MSDGELNWAEISRLERQRRRASRIAEIGHWAAGLGTTAFLGLCVMLATGGIL